MGLGSRTKWRKRPRQVGDDLPGITTYCPGVDEQLRNELLALEGEHQESVREYLLAVGHGAPPTTLWQMRALLRRVAACVQQAQQLMARLPRGAPNGG